MDDVTDSDLEQVYGYPNGTTWVQTNFIASIDGAVAVDGVSAGLGHAADQRVFQLGRDLADVILVGAGTALAEEYRGVRPSPQGTERRRRLGRTAAPPIAVVTSSGRISPTSPLVTDTIAPLIVVTCGRLPAAHRDSLASAGAEVLVAGDNTVDLRYALNELGRRGLRRVYCEGGPLLLAELVALDLVDQVCLTMSPTLVGGKTLGMTRGVSTEIPRNMDLASILTEDNLVFLRYSRRR